MEMATMAEMDQTLEQLIKKIEPKIQNSEEWEKLLPEVIEEGHTDFYHPVIPKRAGLALRMPGVGTACFDFRTNETYLSQEFMNQLHTEGELDIRTVLTGLIKHEIGHYVIYPRECSTLMYIHHFAEGQFKGHEKKVVAYWNDVKNNPRQIIKPERGKEIMSLYRGLNTLLEKGHIFNEWEKKLLELAQIDKNELLAIIRKYSVDRLVSGIYQDQYGKLDLGINLKGEYLEDKLEQLKKLDFLNNNNDEINLVLMGNIVAEVSEKLAEELKPHIQKMQEALKSTLESGLNSTDDEAGEPKSFEEKLKDMIQKMTGPAIADSPDIKDFSDQQLEEGLDKIIRKYGKWRYEKIREEVERATGKKFDRRGEKTSGGGRGIGTAKTNLALNDDSIPYYERLSRTHGLYICPKPLLVDVTNTYPEGSDKFRVGDPASEINVHSTGGRILPGITKKHKYRAGKKRDTQYRVPDLNIWLDSSGSMPNPNNGSVAVLASFILARNYWENGANVGVVNFSGDSAFLLPTRDLLGVYSMLTAFWGGGTVVNVNKIRQYLDLISKPEQRDFQFYTTEEEFIKQHGDYKRFYDKDIEIKLDQTLKETYNRIDTVMITDGGIYNLQEVVEYINSTAKITRNIIFLVDPHSYSNNWTEMNLPNTQVVKVDKIEDLIGLSIGLSKRLVE